jgi:hypothetical protein
MRYKESDMIHHIGDAVPSHAALPAMLGKAKHPTSGTANSVDLKGAPTTSGVSAPG